MICMMLGIGLFLLGLAVLSAFLAFLPFLIRLALAVLLARIVMNLFR